MAFLIPSLCLLFVGTLAAPTEDKTTLDLYMPEVNPQHPDTYLCHGIKMKPTESYITGFIPTANMHIAHHMLLYGCSEPGTKLPVWNCGEMAENTESKIPMAPTCASGSKILYAWAMDAPSLTLPKDVAFEVGGNTDVKYLVLQVHYKNVTSFLPPNNGRDSSGIKLIQQKTKLERRAGVYLLGTGGSIKPHSTVFMETACPFTENIEIHPFAFRTHTHTLGQVVSGYRIRDGKWTEIGRKSPQLPQMFYNVTTPNIVVSRGDILAARCTMTNKLDHAVDVGSTQNDEMCNFYIMYYVDGNKIMNENYCFSNGPPDWSWTDYMQGDLALNKKPDTISKVPGSEKPLEESVTRDAEEDALETVLEELEPRELEELYEELAEEQNPRRDYYYNDEY